MTAANWIPASRLDDAAYRRRRWAWAFYDWANSAFATTILAAVLPTYYSDVASVGIAPTVEASRGIATGYWSLTLSIGLLIVAALSPILGAVADIQRGKKRMLAISAGAGIVGTGLLVLVGTGDWLLASLFFILGRIGFGAANIFYDALLPHVARAEDVDSLSSFGYALGYAGGGLLLFLNVLMIRFLPGAPDYWGVRLSFLSVAIWWAIFTVPVLRAIPEPPAADLGDARQNPITASFGRLRKTFRDIRSYTELLKFLVAFWIYNDGIGTIIGVAAIYGAALGIGSVEIVGALLMVQFVGVPFAIVFGRIPRPDETRRAFYLAFLIWNAVTIPLLSFAALRVLPPEVTGAPFPPYEATDAAVGAGVYQSDDAAIVLAGEWRAETVNNAGHIVTDDPSAAAAITFNGHGVRITRALGPDYGIAALELDGEAIAVLDNISPAVQQADPYTVEALAPDAEGEPALDVGEHTLVIRNTGERNPDSTGTRLAIDLIEVMAPPRAYDLIPVVIVIVANEVIGLALSWFVLQRFLTGWAAGMTTKRGILLALVIYTVISVWGYMIDSVLEFWLLAFLVATVQGGSQALSRSLYASMSPAAKSGEFFGFFSVSEKFAGIIGPIIFAAVIAATAAATGIPSPRPAVLSIVVLFIVGGFLLVRVDVEKGRRIAQEEDARLETAL
ncbi:MAG: MFS transporter [Anaerolineae bacterium]|nr:MFS transporter [Anaerolineae bacterium]